ncbi:MAG: hypothetical protein QW062_01890 [Thermoplasmatales archaeon]
MATNKDNVVLSPHLLYRSSDLELDQKLTQRWVAIFSDIGMNLIIERMAMGDERVKGVCERVLAIGLSNLDDIKYRQDVIRDGIKNKDTIRKLYTKLNDTIDKARKQLFWLGSSSPEYSLYESISILKFYVSFLSYLREIAEANYKEFNSEGFQTLFINIINKFNENYLNEIVENLNRLEFPNGVKVSGKLGRDCELTELKLVKPESRRPWALNISRLSERKLTYVLPERDESGFQELAGIKNKSLLPVTIALKSATDNLLNFVNSLLLELSFIIGCINLYEDLTMRGGAIIFPELRPTEEYALGFEGLYDISLFIKIKDKVVSNSLEPGHQKLIMITGANRGGKSTFLRSIGQSLIMMKAGMFVAAKKFVASIFTSIHTHFKREEEREMTMGKLDEELERMNLILDEVTKGSVILFNESFASTNAIEASQIAGGIISGLVEKGARVIYVTHIYELASQFLDRFSGDVRFLVAERLDTGERTFRIVEGIPTSTSYADDLFRKIFEPNMEKVVTSSKPGDADNL